MKLAFFLQTLEAKITTEIQTTRKTITFVKQETNLFNGEERGKNTISRQNWKRLHWRALA